MADHGWQLVWTIRGIGAIAAAPVMVFCRGGWGRFAVEPTEPPVAAERAGTALAMN